MNHPQDADFVAIECRITEHALTDVINHFNFQNAILHRYTGQRSVGIAHDPTGNPIIRVRLPPSAKGRVRPATSILVDLTTVQVVTTYDLDPVVPL